MMFRSRIDYPSMLPEVQVGSKGRPAVRSLATLLILAIGPIASAQTKAGDTKASNSSAASSSARSKPRAESRVALKPSLSASSTSRAPASLSESAKPPLDETSIGQALRMIAECKSRYRDVTDYSCDFYKRERINGKLTDLHVMSMKERTQPKSLYFKFQQPHRGREAIYVEGRNSGSVLAHDVGFTRFLAGTLELDPKGAMAMEDNRHPVTEAGIGGLIENVERRWTKELHPSHSVINHYQEMQVGPHTSVVMIESIHPTRQPEFLFHKVRVFINEEIGLPIRFEAYDWPKNPLDKPELVEEYTYLNIKLNVGFKEADFDPANAEYSFGPILSLRLLALTGFEIPLEILVLGLQSVILPAVTGLDDID